MFLWMTLGVCGTAKEKKVKIYVFVNGKIVKNLTFSNFKGSAHNLVVQNILKTVMSIFLRLMISQIFIKAHYN